MNKQLEEELEQINCLGVKLLETILQSKVEPLGVFTALIGVLKGLIEVTALNKEEINHMVITAILRENKDG